ALLQQCHQSACRGEQLTIRPGGDDRRGDESGDEPGYPGHRLYQRRPDSGVLSVAGGRMDMRTGGLALGFVRDFGRHRDVVGPYGSIRLGNRHSRGQSRSADRLFERVDTAEGAQLRVEVTTVRWSAPTSTMPALAAVPGSGRVVLR